MPAGVTNYPTSLDSTTNLPDVTGKNQNDGSGDTNAIHSNIHDTADTAIVALETKVGTGSSTPTTTGHVLQVTGAGASAWAAAPAGTPASTIVANTSFARTSTVGTDTPYARQSHDHGMPGEIKEIYFPFAAVTSPTTGTYKYRVKAPSTLLSVRAVLGTVAAAGSDAIFDLNVNGTSVISAGKPQITVGQAINTNAQTFTSTALATNALISVDIDQGSDGFQAGVIVELQTNSPVGAPGTTGVAPTVITIICENGITLSNAAALTDASNGSRFKTKHNLAGYTEARATVGVDAAGAGTEELRIQYSTDGSTWFYLDNTAGPGASLTSANTCSVGSWITIVSAAKADVFLRPVTINGNGSTSPVVGLVTLQLR